MASSSGKTSDSNGRNRARNKHGVGEGEWVTVQAFNLSPTASTLSEMTRTPTWNMENSNDSPSTDISAEAFVDGFEDPEAAKEAYDRPAYTEAPGSADSDDEEGGREAFEALQQVMLERAEFNEDESAAIDENDDGNTVDSSAAPRAYIDLLGAPPGWK